MSIATDKLTPGAVPNIDERLTPGERSFRKLLLIQIIQTGRPVRLTALVAPAGRPLRELEDIVDALQAKGLLVREASGGIAFVYPVSALPTSRRVTLADGRAFFAMCAIDALGSGFEFDQDATVTSACRHCRTPLTIRLKEGVATSQPPGIHALHVDLSNYANWAADC